MSAINVANDHFTCRQIDDFAVLEILEETHLLTTITGKDQLLELLKTIRGSEQIKGLAVLFSKRYKGGAEYKQYLQESLEEKSVQSDTRYSVTYKISLIEVLEFFNTYPMPIVGGMSGDIDPDALAINLVFDVRIATNDCAFVHPDLQLGLPSSPLLTLYLVRNLGPSKATELILTKTKVSSQNAFDLGLINQLVSTEELENACLDKLRMMSAIPGHAIVETRRMLKPEMDDVRHFIDAGFQGVLRSLHKLRQK